MFVMALGEKPGGAIRGWSLPAILLGALLVWAGI
jgi:hypothetical protein